ncbi:glycerol-3-phosphate 1-O-acyltransferase PlsY [Ruminococcus sp. HUN007]|uniref:glycerol-3-phosphate 1-O-acyltransferase PlsY n=1 Tax=Ruminococcus sp. HUN007 TaxID=1514668 RepID=UPI0005D16B84|nr:glycerol-3-phosphate 1-O-acyltransferase PlsY [Ruminococcus sp. HUN007]
MLPYIVIVFCCIAAYLIGSCNSAIIVTKLLKHEDIREFGSKNAGLTNVLRCFGKGPALATLVSDLLKGCLTILVIKAVVKAAGFTGDIMTVGYIAGLLVMLGHVFPVWYGFKGGKGVLVTATVLLAIDPLTFAVVIPVFIIMLVITKYVSVSSITAAVAYPIVTFVMQYFIRHLELGPVLVHTGFAALSGILIVYMHRANIQRLKEGTENKFSFSKK